MNRLEFIANLINTLAWPVVVLIIVILLKKPFSKLLLGLSRLKYNELEMDFEKELSKLEKTIDLQNENGDHNPMDNLLIDEKKENEVLSIAKIHPSAAITLAWIMLEKEIVNTINRLSISADYPLYNSVLKNVNLLKEQKYIDTITYELINEFRQIRNRVSHYHNDGDNLTYLDAVKYFELTNRLIKTLTLINWN